jgi:hypothetical protein
MGKLRLIGRSSFWRFGLSGPGVDAYSYRSSDGLWYRGRSLLRTRWFVIWFDLKEDEIQTPPFEEEFDEDDYWDSV